MKHFATESVLQGVMSGMYSAFDLCKNKFTESVSRLNVENASLTSSIFNKIFTSFIMSHNPRTGTLRSTYMRKKYYKKEFHYIEPIEVAILDNDGSETQYYFSYVPILETIKSWLMNDNVRPYCITPRENSISQGLFDVKDGEAIKNSKYLFSDQKPTISS